jgi:hypothetical protein
MLHTFVSILKKLPGLLPLPIVMAKTTCCNILL